MSAPLQPGMAFRDVTKTHFGRPKVLGMRHGVSIPAVLGQPTVTDDELSSLSQQSSDMMYQTTTRASTRATELLAASKMGPTIVPAHVAFDKKVLCFHGYFKQTVHESPLEHYRVRHIKLYYYLEDDTISVLEPEVPNSGLPQGKLIRRQVLPKDSVGGVWMWKDLNVGQNVTFYSKTFHLTSCDAFTRDFLASNGILVGEDETDVPVDPFTASRRIVEKPVTEYQSPSDFDKLQQFKQLDRKVLRFYCLWDDRATLHGEVRYLILQYYLVDDTLELREEHKPNNGRDQAGTLLSRAKVPRNHRDVPPDFPSIALEKTEAELSDNLGPEDFAIGTTLHVYGRAILIYDCDEFTMAFYRRNFGVEDFTPLAIDAPRPEAPAPELPMPTGFGTHEDSIQSVLSLRPQPPKSNMLKLLEHDNATLRFAAKMVTEDPIDSTRVFTISYKLATDQMSIYEPKTRHFPGGSFLEYGKVKTPESHPADPKYYTEMDLAVGARLVIYGRTFELTEADAWAAKFLAQRRGEPVPGDEE